jgi:hypothetical protein
MKRMRFTIDVQKDLPHMIDAVFIGSPKPGGWVIMEVNDKGRACVEALFPGGHFAWGAPGNVMPADWHGFEINVPGVVAGLPETKLPLEITRGADLDKANSDALAYLLAVGVKNQGGRAAMVRKDRKGRSYLDIIQRHDHAWH